MPSELMRFDDAVGNLTDDSLHTYTGACPERRRRDAGPLRIKRVYAGVTAVYIFSGSKLIAVYANGAPDGEYIYAGSTRVAQAYAGTTYYYHPDHLDERVLTDSSAGEIWLGGHYPFGENWYELIGGDGWRFTSYLRDFESGLDYATFRNYSSRLGRFAQADLLGGSIASPQSLNRYAYVLNNPTGFVDPLGLSCSDPNDPSTCVVDPVGSSVTVTDTFTPIPLVDIDLFFHSLTASGSDTGAIPLLLARTLRSVALRVQRTFQRTFPCTSSASGVMNALENNFAAFANNPAQGNFSTFSIFTPGAVSPGQQIGINVGVQAFGHTIGYSDVSVTVQSATPTQLVFQSNSGHVLYPATVSFSASDAGNSSITFATSVNATTNGLWGTAQFYVFGGRAGESSTWNSLLNNVRDFCSLPSHP